MDVLASAKYPASLTSRLHETWAVARSGPISHRDGTTARQASILDAFRRSIRRAREEMADAGYAPDRIVALSTYLGLAASDLIEYLCAGTVLRQGRIQPALSRGAWVSGYELAEIGGHVIQRLWQRRISAMSAVIESNASLPRTASVVSGDMVDLPLEGERFDLVVWDPPFYDNIDYDLLAAPWTSFLRSVIGELDANLRWPLVQPSADIKLPDRFDPEAYEQSLSEAAGQVVKLARPSARLGVFWVSRAAQDLQRFVGLMQPKGLELIQTIALRTELPRHDEAPETYLLVLRVLKKAGGSTGPLVNAERLLELSSTGQQSLAAGLAGVLAESLDAEEMNSLLPESLKGSVNQRLAELSQRSPTRPTFSVSLASHVCAGGRTPGVQPRATRRVGHCRTCASGSATTRIHCSVSPCVLHRSRPARCRPSTQSPAVGCQRYGSDGQWYGSYRFYRAHPPVLGCYLVHAQPGR